MVTQILDEYRTACKVVLLERQSRDPATVRPAFVVRCSVWYSTEAEAREAYKTAVTAHTKRHKRTDGANSEQTQGKRKSR